MKKCLVLFTSVALVAQMGLFAQEAPQSAAVKTPESLAAKAPESVPAATGSSAAQSSRAANSSNWQNWIFAGTALAIAAIGAIVVSLNSGEEAH